MALKPDYLQSYPFISSMEEAWLKKVGPNGYLGTSSSSAPTTYCTLPRTRPTHLTPLLATYPQGASTLPRSVGRKSPRGRRSPRPDRSRSPRMSAQQVRDRSSRGLWEGLEGFKERTPIREVPQPIPIPRWQVGYILACKESYCNMCIYVHEFHMEETILWR